MTALERLHLLKKDTSQIGINAREAVKFLDRVTSGKDGLDPESVVLQGPEEQYATWGQVEAHFVKEETEAEISARGEVQASSTSRATGSDTTASTASKAPEVVVGPLSRMLLNKLNFAKDTDVTSAASTPPTSPSTTGPQSSKTSPEVKTADLVEGDASGVPPTLKPLLNSVVWYMYEKPKTSRYFDTFFLTNASDTASLARSFGLIPKNIHQLRTLIGLEEQEAKNHAQYEKKHPSRPSTSNGVLPLEPKPLFRYEEDSDEEMVVFKPRGRGTRGGGPGRGVSSAPGRGSPRHSVSSFSSPGKAALNKPQIPTEEIDPDSFDRGGFARGSVPLADTGLTPRGHFHGIHRGSSHRGGFLPSGNARGGFSRGASRGFDRGNSVRGRGRLFVP